MLTPSFTFFPLTFFSHWVSNSNNLHHLSLKLKLSFFLNRNPLFFLTFKLEINLDDIKGSTWFSLPRNRTVYFLFIQSSINSSTWGVGCISHSNWFSWWESTLFCLSLPHLQPLEDPVLSKSSVTMREVLQNPGCEAEQIMPNCSVPGRRNGWKTMDRTKLVFYLIKKKSGREIQNSKTTIKYHGSHPLGWL